VSDILKLYIKLNVIFYMIIAKNYLRVILKLKQRCTKSKFGYIWWNICFLLHGLVMYLDP